jgi:hypothetical protein
MNAFHPDYIKTFHPQFLTDIAIKSAQIEQGKINGKKARKTRESVRSVSDIKAFPLTRSKR